MPQLRYRPEIDGLRALAVFPVIFFHAGFGWVSGGFAGVDVFFVISGYLITSIILSEIHAGTFTFAGFYERRARRILPALFFVMILCIPFAWFLLTPSELKQFSLGFASTVISLSNLHFMKGAGYFNAGADNQPLLHTWSLAVEEQYYLLFPLLLLLLVKARKLLVPCLVVLTVAGLAYAEYKSAGGSSKVFFDTRARGWALLVGSLIPILALEEKTLSLSRRVRESLAILGLFLVAWGVVWFDKNMPYPGLATLVPVLGTALIVVSATSTTLTGRALGLKPLVGIGLISYSAYLIHQPLFAFFRLHKAGTPEPWQMLVLSAASLVLAFFSWKYVETPFRNRANFPRARIFYGAGIVGGTLLAIGVITHAENGFFGLPGRDQDVMIYAKYDKRPLYREETCFLEMEQDENAFGEDCKAGRGARNSVLIWGDSHAAAAYVGIGEVLGKRVSQYTAAGCPPLLEADVAGSPHCRSINAFVLRQIAEQMPSAVILHANWRAAGERTSLEKLRNTLVAIRRISQTIRVIVLGGIPQWQSSLPAQLNKLHSTLAAESWLENPDLTLVRGEDETVRRIVSDFGGEFVSALDVYCSGKECLAVGKWGGHYEPIAWDDSHLTQTGSLILARGLLNRIGLIDQKQNLTLSRYAN